MKCYSLQGTMVESPGGAWVSRSDVDYEIKCKLEEQREEIAKELQEAANYRDNSGAYHDASIIRRLASDIRSLPASPKAPECMCHPHDLSYYGCRCKAPERKPLALLDENFFVMDGKVLAKAINEVMQRLNEMEAGK
jgi:hypothetical protein